MPRKLRAAKGRREVELTLNQIIERARIGGMLPNVPELTPEQRAIWEAYRRSQSDWVPPRALQYAFARVDPIHGRGGRYVAGRPRRPDDPDTGDGWVLDRFLSALAEDQLEIAAVTAKHPAQAGRLAKWTREIEALGRQRDTDANPPMAFYYERLSQLGYDTVSKDNH